MNYISQIKEFWVRQNQYSLNVTDIALYFYLLELNNLCAWADTFSRNNKKIEADLDISFKTLSNSRNRLKQAGLIGYKTLNGNPNVKYTFGKFPKVADEVRDEGKDEVRDEINKTKTKTKENISSNEDIQKKNPDFEKFEIWIKENAPYCSNPKNLKQLSESEFLKLKEDYTAMQIADIITQLENRKDLRKKYATLYRTLLNWLKTNYKNE